MLGVERDANARTIKDAFRQLARQHHPGVSTEPDAEQRFQEIAEAYGKAAILPAGAVTALVLRSTGPPVTQADWRCGP